MGTIVGIVMSLFSIFLVIHLVFVNYVAKQARERGYRYWEWLVAGFLSNSIVFAIMLALLPDRSLEKRRSEKRALLLEKLRHRQLGATPHGLAGTKLHTSLGDMATFDPERLGMAQSIGDQETCQPIDELSLGHASTRTHLLGRSVGDQETIG